VGGECFVEALDGFEAVNCYFEVGLEVWVLEGLSTPPFVYHPVIEHSSMRENNTHVTKPRTFISPGLPLLPFFLIPAA
jgi:hypothetical protein